MQLTKPLQLVGVSPLEGKGKGNLNAACAAVETKLDNKPAHNGTRRPLKNPLLYQHLCSCINVNYSLCVKERRCNELNWHIHALSTLGNVNAILMFLLPSNAI